MLYTERPVQPYQKPAPVPTEIQQMAKTIEAVRSSGTEDSVPAMAVVVVPIPKPQSPFTTAFFKRRLVIPCSFIAHRRYRRGR